LERGVHEGDWSAEFGMRNAGLPMMT
jgi:hypothetical protein